MYSREELDPSFGPYEVNICDEIIMLKDGTRISNKFWFPGPKKPFGDNVSWSNYCQAVEENSFEEKFPLAWGSRDSGFRLPYITFELNIAGLTRTSTRSGASRGCSTSRR